MSLDLENIVSNINVEVNILGLALSHFDEQAKKWILFFPVAHNHKLKVNIQKIDKSDPKKSGSGVEFSFPPTSEYGPIPSFKIRVNSISSKKIEAQYKKEFVEEIIDFSEIHGKAEQPEEIYLSDELNSYQGILTVENSTLVTNKVSEDILYNLWKAEPHPNPLRKEVVEPIERKIGKTGKFSFQLQEDDKLEFLISGLEEMGMSINTPPQNIRYEISVENECLIDNEPLCEEADFKYYYDIIDMKNLKEKYELVPIEEDEGKGKTGSCDKSIASKLNIPQKILDQI